MRAVEINSKTDKKGHLKNDFQLDNSNSPVDVLILQYKDNAETKEEKFWINSLSTKPALNILNEHVEKIYLINYG